MLRKEEVPQQRERRTKAWSRKTPRVSGQA